MNDEEREELLKILDGNVGEVKDALEGKSEDELKALLEAEQNDKPRKGVVDAINAILNPDAPEQEEAPKRTAKDIESEISSLESGAIDIKIADRLNKLRAELIEAEK